MWFFSYAADEIDLCKALKIWGRQRDLQFVILTRHPLETSPRKMLLYSGWEMAGQMPRLILNPRGALQDKWQLPIWYDGSAYMAGLRAGGRIIAG